MADPPTLTDGAIVLDAFTEDDVVAHVAGEDDEHARRFGWYPERSTEETARAAIEDWRRDWETDGPTRAFAARRSEGRVLVGGCQLRLRSPDIAQLSYWVFPEHRRRGYASCMVRIVCDYAFDDLGVQRIEALVEPDNDASHGVVRSVGFVREGVLRKRSRYGDDLRDMVIYSYLPEDR
jgi:RimJ/RimL family protein N-acetyltransferase